MSEPTPLLSPLKPVLVAARLWKDGKFIPDDWSVLSEEVPIPIGGRSIISLARWRAGPDHHAAFAKPVGLRLQPSDLIDPLADDIARLGVIALAFPKFSDGRAYSTARRLREAGYSGEVRATGDVLLDQLPLMLRAGFDAFEITHLATIVALEAAPIPAISRVYQAGTEATSGLWRSRRASAAN